MPNRSQELSAHKIQILSTFAKYIQILRNASSLGVETLISKISSSQDRIKEADV